MVLAHVSAGLPAAPSPELVNTARNAPLMVLVTTFLTLISAGLCTNRWQPS